MKFFIDTADLDEIREAMSWGTLPGVTTNLSLYARTGGEPADFEQHVMKVCEVCEGLPVSIKSATTTTQEVVGEGKRLAGLTPNVVTKLPIGVESLTATEALTEDGVAVNMTLVFSTLQALLTARAGAHYISPFVGRIDDISSDGVADLEEAVRCTHNYDFGHECEIIAASVRSPYHITATTLMGADIATVPFGTLKNCVKHPLAAKGLAKFKADWERVKNA